MEQIPKVYLTVILTLIITVLSFGIISAEAQSSKAKDFKSDVVAQIEASDFDTDVMKELVASAKDNGYTLYLKDDPKDLGDPDTQSVLVTNTKYNQKICYVTLKYSFDIGIFGIHREHITQAIAR